MATIHYTAIPQVLRHTQDESTTYCGRACAQMVIAALVIKPAPYQNPKLKITQLSLFLREHDHSPEDSSNDNVWHTHPDEMCALLRDCSDLKDAGLDDWRLAAYPKQTNHLGARQLLADVVMALKTEKKPAAITWDCNDHWIVVVGARLGSSRGVIFEILDPLDSMTAPATHKYWDKCNGNQSGTTYILVEDHAGPVLLRRSLDVAQRQIPNQLNDYAGKCVGVLYGKAPDADDLDDFVKEIFPAVSPRQPFEDRLAEIRYVAETWDIEPLQEFLDSRPVVVADQPVFELASGEPAYQLVSLKSETPANGWRGLLAVFSPSSGALTQVRFTSDPRAIESLSKVQERRLLWSPNQPEVFSSPYFPFVRNEALDGFIRLFDRKPVNLPE